MQPALPHVPSMKQGPGAVRSFLAMIAFWWLPIAVTQSKVGHHKLMSQLWQMCSITELSRTLENSKFIVVHHFVSAACSILPKVHKRMLWSRPALWWSREVYHQYEDMLHRLWGYAQIHVFFLPWKISKLLYCDCTLFHNNIHISNRTTMHTEYTILNAIHCDATKQSLHGAGFQYHHFRMGWYSFLTLLDIDLSEGFCCEQCGSRPDTVIMDGTSVSFRKALDSWGSLLDLTVDSKPRLGR